MNKITALVLIMVSLCSAEQYINPTNNTVSGGGTINNNVIIHQPVRVDTLVVENTDTVVIEQSGSVINQQITPYIKCVSVGGEYIIPLIEDTKFYNGGVGIKLNAMFSINTSKILGGVRIGYSHFNDIVFSDNDIPKTGNTYYDNLYAVGEETPYKSFEASMLVGGKRIQGIMGYGNFIGESSIVAGVRLDTHTKVGVNASFNNFINSEKFIQEIGFGISVKL